MAEKERMNAHSTPQDAGANSGSSDNQISGTSAAQHSGVGDDEGTSQDSSEVEAPETMSPATSGGYAGGVLDEYYWESSENVDKEVVEKLQEAVKERDQKIKRLSSQLQSVLRTAADVEKIVKHSKDQSGEIARLKKQLEIADTKDLEVTKERASEAAVTLEHYKQQNIELQEQCQDLQAEKEAMKVMAKVIQSSSESEALQMKLTETLTTVRRLHIQTKKLEEENKILKDGAHRIANTKMAEVERENASLKEKAEEREKVNAAMGSKLGVLNQQKAAFEEQNQSLTEANKHLEDFSHHLEQKVIGQQASIQNIMQDLHVTKERASEAAVTLERYKQHNSELQKQCQDLQGEKEAMKAMAEVYKEDFNNERKDRESAHAQKTALEERFAAEVAKLKEQLQRVSADNGRVSKTMREKEGQLQRQVQEMSQHIETLNINKNVLQGEIQGKTQQVKLYKKQVDQFRGELDRCRAEMVAYKQQAEGHKQQIEGTVHQSEQIAHTARVLQEENQRLKKDINVLASREHLRQHAAQRSQGQVQGGREGSHISVEEFTKERRKHEEVERALRNMEEKLEEMKVQKEIQRQQYQQLLAEHRQLQQEWQQHQKEYEQEQQRSQERVEYAEVRAREAEAQLQQVQSHWIIPRSEIELTEEELGRGSWGKVKVAKFRGTRVAAKCYYKILVSEHNVRQFRREINIAARLRHPNLVQFIGASMEGELILVTELMMTSLGDLMHRGPLNEANITSISLDIAQALNYLHLMQPHPIIHRDICSGNVLLNPLPEDCWKAKVSDYGSVNLLQHLTTAHPGNPFYAAPESEYPRLQTAKMDIYSFGVLLAEMLTNELPEKKDRHRQILKISVERPTFIKLVRQCLNEESVHRPSAQEMITTFSQLRMR